MESGSAGNGATAGGTETAMQPEGIASNHVIVSESQVKVSVSAWMNQMVKSDCM
jgi:hypothetical protein